MYGDRYCVLSPTKKFRNGEFTGYVWNGSSLAAETNDSTITNLYTYGADGITTAQINGTTNIYLKNVHGDVVGITDANGTLQKSYRYDAFGNEQNPDENDPNPFRYCGEYFDSETDNIYLRNRYYSPNIGRFITEDPIRDGLNWYTYCAGNPVNLIDPLGLFDYNTRLSYSQTYNEDVEVLQNELAWLGYLDMSGGGWGYYGLKTQAAVNAYKNDMGLGNTGADAGVVGLQTWTSLGLIYRTQADIDAGVTISMVGGRTQYKDFSNPINTALAETVQIAEEKWRIDYLWFYNQVNHNESWDIKRPKPWNETIAANTYPGWGVKVYYSGYLMTPEELGNYTYGYIGAALGLSYAELYGGSWMAGGFPIGDDFKNNEFKDWISITRGVEDYKNK